MARPCSLCAHPDRQAVDDALLAGDPYRNIAARCSVSLGALSRHKAHLAPDPAALPTVAGGFQVLLIDPPWSFVTRSAKGAGRSPDYPVMTLREICALPVRTIAAPDSVLFLWITGPMLVEAQRVIRAWGFRYSTIAFTWVKLNADGSPFMGTGYTSRANAELCLLAIRGKGLPRQAMDVAQVILSRRREHSRKPDIAYQRIARLYGPDVRRVELFARTAWPGWAAWGWEVSRFAVPMPLALEDAAG
jgi:N6-adenosine-specific RNA methylase IME4